MSQAHRSTPLAALAPLFCAVHCAVTPLLVVSIPALAGGIWFERATFVLSLGLATWSVAGGIRHHGDRRVALPVAAGLVAWALLLLAPHAAPHPEALHALSATVVAMGLLWNARRRHHAATSGPCPACASDHGE